MVKVNSKYFEKSRINGDQPSTPLPNSSILMKLNLIFQRKHFNDPTFSKY